MTAGAYNLSMLRWYDTAAPGPPGLVLTHGAGAGHDHPWMVRAAQGLAARGVRTATFNFPYKEAGRSAPDRPAVLEEAWRDAWAEAARAVRGPMFAAGKSMGGRIASQAAARRLLLPAPAGLVFFGYPLHPPAKPAQRRDQHLPHVGAPMLFLSGTRDPFGSPEELGALVAALPDATLELIEGGDHSLALSKTRDPKGASLDEALETAARWILGGNGAMRQ